MNSKSMLTAILPLSHLTPRGLIILIWRWCQLIVSIGCASVFSQPTALKFIPLTTSSLVRWLWSNLLRMVVVGIIIDTAGAPCGVELAISLHLDLLACTCHYRWWDLQGEILWSMMTAAACLWRQDGHRRPPDEEHRGLELAVMLDMYAYCKKKKKKRLRPKKISLVKR